MRGGSKRRDETKYAEVKDIFQSPTFLPATSQDLFLDQAQEHEENEASKTITKTIKRYRNKQYNKLLVIPSSVFKAFIVDLIKGTDENNGFLTMVENSDFLREFENLEYEGDYYDYDFSGNKMEYVTPWRMLDYKTGNIFWGEERPRDRIYSIYYNTTQNLVNLCDLFIQILYQNRFTYKTLPRTYDVFKQHPFFNTNNTLRKDNYLRDLIIRFFRKVISEYEMNTHTRTLLLGEFLDYFKMVIRIKTPTSGKRKKQATKRSKQKPK